MKKNIKEFIAKNQRVTKLILGGLLLLNFSEGGDQFSWVDQNNTVHKNSTVSISTAKNMVISSCVKLKKPRETRIKINQGWGCLALENGWSKEDYKKINDNTAVLNVGSLDFVGADLGFFQGDKNCFYLLGKKGCELFHNSEHWTAEQKINGSWVAVASGVFTFVK